MKVVTILGLETNDFKVGYTMDIIYLETGQTAKCCVYLVNDVDDIVYFYYVEDPEDNDYICIDDLSVNGVFGEWVRKQILRLYDENGQTIWSHPF